MFLRIYLIVNFRKIKKEDKNVTNLVVVISTEIAAITTIVIEGFVEIFTIVVIVLVILILIQLIVGIVHAAILIHILGIHHQLLGLKYIENVQLIFFL